MIRQFAKLLVLFALTIVAGCASPPAGGPPLASQNEIADLARGIKSLGSEIDPEEAERAAEIAMLYPNRLAKEYGITDHPLIHNSKVNQRLRPRGLCWHWADDMQNRLAQENFKTLSLHRAIANSDSTFLIEHSTVIISQRGHGQDQGIVLDPWRNGGVLYWAPTLKDEKYTWIPRSDVFRKKLRRSSNRRANAS
ncbi:MAG TPA: hypothetical protein DD729_03580 [Rhodobacteraceae bacterium]|nr:hypothetical protein [Paracoccaceae bacterium]